MFSEEEKKRYERHFLLPGFGAEGQEKLRAASVLVIGAGGLGCPVLQYLAAAGIGRIGIVDDDTVDFSNLQRQILYDESDIGKPKAEAAAVRIRRINPRVDAVVYRERLVNRNALELFAAYDLIVDATDNFSSRYRISDAAVLSGKPCVSGSVFRFEGQVYALNVPAADGKRSPDYRMLFPEEPGKKNGVDCNTAGVLGVLPGIVGTMQAAETIKIITGLGEPLAGKIFLIDIRTMQSLTVAVPAGEKKPGSFPASAQAFLDWDYGDGTCATPGEIEAAALQELLDTDPGLVLVDVRMPGEFPEVEKLEALQIPLPELQSRADEIPSGGTVVLFCKSGVRSRQAAGVLRSCLPGRKILSLAGGVVSWNRSVISE